MKINHWFYVILIIVVAFIIRLIFILRADFPLNDGGMFYTMTEDLIKNNFQIPAFTTYNLDKIPFAYSPLAFYVSATLHTFFGIPLIQIFRFLPLFISVLNLPIFYILSAVILRSKNSAVLALLVFITTPRSFESLILGGGMTRSFGFLFAMISIYFAYKFYTENRNKSLFLTTIFLTLSLLSHVENAVFAVLTIFILYFIFDRTKKGFLKSLWIPAGVLLLSSFWWLKVFVVHGLSPFISAVSSNPRDAFTFAQIGLLSYLSEPKIPVIYGLFILGFILSIVKRSYFLPIWFLTLLIAATRMIHIAAFVPISMMAGLALDKFLDDKKKTTSIIALSIFMFLSLITAFGHQLTPLDHLKKNERTAMQWINANTKASDKFLVVSPKPGWAWFIDYSQEWFPTIAKRQSISTVQAYEWLPGFSERLILNKKFKDCNDGDIRCIEQVARATKSAYTHIYINKDLRLEQDLPSCCSFLVHSLKNASNYRLIYNGHGAWVWAKIDIF